MVDSKLLVLEGNDSSGKSTQANLIQNYFKENNIKYEGLTLSEFEDAGYFESLSVMTYVFSPSSELNAFYFL